MSIPTLLVIQRSHFPEGIALEECERQETVNGESAIVRFQRQADINVFQRIGRFFSDLLNGVTRAQGYLCSKSETPATFNIRGQWFETQKASQGAYANPIPQGVPTGQVLYQRIRVEVQDRTDDTPAGWDDTIARRISDELHDRYGALQAGKASPQDGDASPVQAFLYWQERRPANMGEGQLKRLSAFKEAYADFRDELGEQVRYRVNVALDQLGKQIEGSESLRELANRTGWYGPPPPPAPAAPPPPPILSTQGVLKKAVPAKSDASRPATAGTPPSDANDALMAQLRQKLGRMREKTDESKNAVDDRDWDA